MIELPKNISKYLLKAGYSLFQLDVFDKLAWLKGTMEWSNESRQKWRLERLGDILDFAWDNVPFYREYWGDHGVNFRRPRHLDELKSFPVVRKETLRANIRSFKPRSLKSIRHTHKHTGGSTSVPVHYLLDTEQWTLMEAFHSWGWAQAGYELGDPVAVVAGGSLLPERMTLKNRLRNYAQRRLFIYGVAMDSNLARKYHATLSRQGTEFLYGYPSILYLFANFLSEQNLKLPKLKAAITTAEMLLPQYRDGIEKGLSCPVFNNLGSNDGGFESYECHLHQGFHYNDLQSILETCPSDTDSDLGHLLITNLWNRSTPFIRYENGDLVSLSKKPCPCNAPFPLISSIHGRTADILTFSNGRSLSGPALTLIFGDMQIDGWQIVQTGHDSLEVRVLCQGDLNPSYVERISRIIDHHVNGDSHRVALNVRKVDKLELTQGGKLKPIWKSDGL